MPETIPFNKPHFPGKEFAYIRQALWHGKLSGNGLFTKKCHQFFQDRFGFHKTLLTTSCTDALEMAAILLNLQPGDEVIVPSFTFPSTANAFVLRGAKIVFADSGKDNPNLDVEQLESLITNKTKAIVPVHYAGVACDMDAIMHLAKQYHLFVVEDAAQAIDSYYKGAALGSIGHLAAFSFHETKNISSGEGGMLAINDPSFALRSEVIWEKGTNRSAFFRGEVNKYGWIDVGSSFLPSEITAALLYAQLENLKKIQQKRCYLWQCYYEALRPLAKIGHFSLPSLPPYATLNGHLFYLICYSESDREQLLDFLKEHGIMAIFHYQSLHLSDFYKNLHDGRELSHADRYSQCLLRLPLYYSLTNGQIQFIVDKIEEFFND